MEGGGGREETQRRGEERDQGRPFISSPYGPPPPPPPPRLQAFLEELGSAEVGNRSAALSRARGSTSLIQPLRSGRA
ncbi:hypothetical protein EYF80_057164 [Liparis tanakae]|uniref:Uncharacterized protein n=1 Tax=Liparis tanakae TaxID=230148 RepID=A0A4Z2EUR3_9TELE|nr:hypothetical protein EYF80_057164 [Liparis tanakae]